MTQYYRQAASVQCHAPIKYPLVVLVLHNMTEYRKRKRLDEDNCKNVPKRTNLNAERQREYRETHKSLSADF
jgi:hypothetical protein